VKEESSISKYIPEYKQDLGNYDSLRGR